MNRPDWRESLTNAADLALLGIAVILGCLPLVTAGAAITAASVAADRLCARHAVPGPRDLLAAARRALWSGAAVTVVALVVTTVLVVDVWLLRTAAVPGARVVTAVLALVTAGLVTVAAVAVVRVGQDQASGWRRAMRWSVRLLLDEPGSAIAILATLAVPTVLAVTMPVTSLLLPGFVLFALHVVVRRADRRRVARSSDVVVV